MPIGIAAQEQAQSVALLDLHDGHRGGGEFRHRSLEQVVARQPLERLQQPLAQVAAGRKAGAAQHLGHLAAHAGNALHALAVDRRGIQAHEAALAQHPPVLPQLAQGDIVRIHRAVHPRRLVGLGEGQPARRAQPGQGRGRQLALRRVQPAAQAPRHAEQRGLVVDDQPAAVGLRLDAKLLVAEEGEVIVQQPGEEFAHLGAVVGGQRRLQLRPQGAQALLHRPVVGHGQAHVGEHLVQGLGQQVAGTGAGAAVDLQADQRLATDVVARGPRRQQFEPLARGATAQLEHAVLHAVHGMPAAAQLHAQRVDQKRHVGMQHLQHAVRRLPAVMFVVGVEQQHLRCRRVEAAEQAPGRQAAAGQIGQAALAQLVEGDAGEEATGEHRHLRQLRRIELARQHLEQLAVKIVALRRAEESHGPSPLTGR
ncbi:hypothetical protein D3C81_1164580 [compost metagenome]